MQGILLAAGVGRRFQTIDAGDQDKLLAPIGSHSVLWHSATALINALPNSVAVIQSHQTKRKKILQDLGFSVLESKRAEKGMGYALADAVQATKNAEGWLIALADMPWVTTILMQKIIEKVTDQDSIAAPKFSGKRGQPVAFGRAWAKQLSALQGDAGARDLLKTAAINWLDWHDDSIHRDVDTQVDLSLSKIT